MAASRDVFPLLQLPDTAFEHVFRFISYEVIAKLRRVCRRFNNTGKRLLNKGFRNAEKYHTKCLKDMKAMLPRRESERRNHKLSRHCDILTAIETRISLLNMTFVKYVEHDLCCFIPGKVVDEIYSVLRTLQGEEQPPRAYEILQELRDISSMAMEYFDEKIVPGLPCPMSPLKTSFLSGMAGVVSAGASFALAARYPDLDTPTSSRAQRFGERLGLSEPAGRRVSTMRDLDAVSKSNKKLAKKTNRVVSNLKRQADTAKSAVESQNKKITELDKRIDQQNEVIEQQNARLAEQEEKLAEMNRRLIENEQIMSDLAQSAQEKTRSSLGAGPERGPGGRKRPPGPGEGGGKRPRLEGGQ